MLETILGLTTLAVGFAWLLHETDWLRVRLLVGAGKPRAPRIYALAAPAPILQLAAPKVALDPETSPYYWMSAEAKQTHLTLCVGCRNKCQERTSERWASWKLPARTIKAWDSTLNLNECCNIWRAKFLKQVARNYKRKTAPATQAPLPVFVESGRLGSHSEFHPTDDNGHGYHQTVIDYKTVFNDCLPGKDWLAAHYQDVIPEPTIELLVDGEVKATINGNYKKGVIKDLVKRYAVAA